MGVFKRFEQWLGLDNPDDTGGPWALPMASEARLESKSRLEQKQIGKFDRVWVRIREAINLGWFSYSGRGVLPDEYVKIFTKQYGYRVDQNKVGQEDMFTIRWD